jgi:hypothetical protein
MSTGRNEEERKVEHAPRWKEGRRRVEGGYGRRKEGGRRISKEEEGGRRMGPEEKWSVQGVESRMERAGG